jgi:hypothetical protein
VKDQFTEQTLLPFALIRIFACGTWIDYPASQGEGVGGRECGMPDSGKHNEEVQLCAFDVLAMDGDDLRNLPLSMHKANLQRLLARRPDGIFLSDFEQGEIRPDLFRAACRMGLEGLVSKHRDRPYRGGRQKHWIKVKNRSHPAMDRVLESFR